VDLEGTVIFYTSDHGQALRPRSGGGVVTHCDWDEPVPDEGLVPFLLFARDPASLFPEGPRMNAYSHFQLFPSTLQLMGYGSGQRDGTTVFEGAWPGPRQFFSGDIFGVGVRSGIVAP